jgi:uncharacterized 2Fe-2S/4Fe-4S cluster protein (DUF4445 family)
MAAPVITAACLSAAIIEIITYMSKKNKGPFEVDFEPIGRRIQVGAGETLLDAARASGVQIASICGGAGLCESCIIRLRDGELSDLSLEEQSAREEGWLAEDERLACQTTPLSDVTIDIPPKSMTTSQRLQLEADISQISLNPMTRVINLQMDPPTITRPEQVLRELEPALEHAGVGEVRCEASLVQELATTLDEHSWNVRIVLRDDEIVAALPNDQSQLGIAVDLGTTKIAVFLMNLETGDTLAQKGAMNPQISYGEDVISRISYANKGERERRELTSIIIESINAAVGDLCDSTDHPREAIVDAVVVGNTVMHHAFLGLPLRQLGVAPFAPAVDGSMVVQTRDLGLDIAKGAYVYLPPNIAGYVGADHTAVLLATDFIEEGGVSLVVDIGTNTEISLKIHDRILSCSCASGPAFEGAHIRDGMRAAPGAIERVQPANGGFRWQTVDDQPPIGICGSGMLDAVAALRLLGWIDRSGRLQEDSTDPDHWHAEGICLVGGNESGHGSDIVLTRNDIHEIQLAQGAIRAGIEVLLKEAKIAPGDLQRVFLAGAFGTYLNASSAMATGLLPTIELERILQVGNAAGEGARQLLLSKEKRDEVEKILDRVEYIELTTHPAFTDLYMQHLYLG